MDMESWIRDHYLRILAQIDEYGVSIQGVFDPEGEDPPFAYTVGLYKLIRHEVIVIGLPPRVAQTLLNLVHQKVMDGLIPQNGLVVEGIALAVPVMFIDVLNRGEFGMGVADRIMRDDGGQVSVFQLVWPLGDGTWPKESAAQPLLGNLPLDPPVLKQRAAGWSL